MEDMIYRCAICNESMLRSDVYLDDELCDDCFAGIWGNIESDFVFFLGEINI